MIREFSLFVLSGESITPKNIRTKRNDLLVQIRRKFGSFQSFVERLGYDYEEIIGYTVWSKDRIVNDIQTRNEKGESVKRADMEKQCPALLSSAIKHFGSFKAVMEACGLSYEDNLRFTWWNREKIIGEFLILYEDESVTTISQLRDKNRGLDHAIRKVFGTYDALCYELGLDVTKIRSEVYEWSSDDLLQALRDCREKGMPLNVMSVSSVFPSAVKVANRYFGSYATALSEIGEEYPLHSDDRLRASAMGYTFENLLAEAFTVIRPSFQYHYRGFNGIVPDFYDPKTRQIVDAKLSSWSIFNCDTVQKYMPYCTSLTAIYLRGPDIKHEVANLTLIPVSNYYEEITAAGRSDIVSKFELIRNTIPECAVTAPTPELLAA